MPVKSVGEFQAMMDAHKTREWVNHGQFDRFIPNIENGKQEGSFVDMLTTKISEVNDLQKKADLSIQNLVTGRTKNIHETMVAVEKAELAFKTMNQVRNKVIDAYKDVMRMQV